MRHQRHLHLPRQGQHQRLTNLHPSPPRHPQLQNQRILPRLLLRKIHPLPRIRLQLVREILLQLGKERNLCPRTVHAETDIPGCVLSRSHECQA